MDESEIEVDGSLRIPRVQCTRDAFFHFLPILGVRDLVCWALRTETTVRLAKIERREGSYTKTLESKYLVDVYPKTGAEGTKSNVTGRARDEYTFSRKAHPQLVFVDFASDDTDGDCGGLTPIEIEESKKRKWMGGGYTMDIPWIDEQGGRRNGVAVPPTMLHFEILLEAYCGYSLAAVESWDGKSSGKSRLPDRMKSKPSPRNTREEIYRMHSKLEHKREEAGMGRDAPPDERDERRNTLSCFNSPDSSCPRSAVMGGAVVAALASYQDEEVLEAFGMSEMFDDAGGSLGEDGEAYWAAKELLIHNLHGYFLSKERNENDDDLLDDRDEWGDEDDLDEWDMPARQPAWSRPAATSPFAKGDVDIFLQACPLTREILGVLEASGIGGNPDLFDLIGSFVGNAGVCESDLERFATAVIGDNGAIEAPEDTQFAFARSKHALSFILGKEYVRNDDHGYRGKLWPRTSQFIMLDPQADLLGGLLDFDQSIVACSYDGVSVRIAPRAALSLMTKANFVTPFCFEERRNKKRVQKYSSRGFKPFIVDPNDNGPVQNLSCNAVIPRKTFAPPTNVDYREHHDRHEMEEIKRIQSEKMDDEYRVYCCHELEAIGRGGREEVQYRQLGHDPRKLYRNDPPYTQMMFERSPGDAIDFFRQRFNWSEEDRLAVNAIDPYMRMACRKCKAEYILIRVVMAKYPDLLKEYDLEDDNLRGEFLYMHTSGTEVHNVFSPSFYSGGVFDGTYVRENARPVDKIESMLHSQSIFEVSSYVMKHGSPEGYLKRFVHSTHLDTVLQKGRKALLQTPARPTVGLNPERFVERCTNCQNWLLGNRYGSKECTRCDSER